MFSKSLLGMQPCRPAALPAEPPPDSKHCPMRLLLKYLFFSLNRRNQVSHPYKKTAKIFNQYIIRYKMGRLWFLKEKVACIPKFNQIIISSFGTRIKSSCTMEKLEFKWHPLIFLFLGMSLVVSSILHCTLEAEYKKFWAPNSLLSHWHCFLVITKNADTGCSKRISEENQWRI